MPSCSSRHRFSSANSINIGRLLPQMVYYVGLEPGGRAPHTAARRRYIIPAGNLGNAFAGRVGARARACRSGASCSRTTPTAPCRTSCRPASGSRGRASRRWPRPWTSAIRATWSACARCIRRSRDARAADAPTASMTPRSARASSRTSCRIRTHLVPAYGHRRGGLPRACRRRSGATAVGAGRHRASGQVPRDRRAAHRRARSRCRRVSRGCCSCRSSFHGSAADADGARRGTRMSDLHIDPKWIWRRCGARSCWPAAGVCGACAPTGAMRAAARCSTRLERIAFEAAHQVLVPDGMGGHIHVDHLLLTPRGFLVLDTRRVAGLIFGGDQMSEWTVMARGRRYTFDNPQPALYDRDRRGQGAGRRAAGRGPAAVLQRRQVHQGHAQVGADAGRHGGGISAWSTAASRRPPAFAEIAARLDAARRAAAARARTPSPASSRPGARPNSRTALRVVVSASASGDVAAQRRPRRARCAADTPARCAAIGAPGRRSRGSR